MFSSRTQEKEKQFTLFFDDFGKLFCRLTRKAKIAARKF